MKLQASFLITILALIFGLAINTYAISSASIDKALSPFVTDILAKIPKGIKNVSVYGVLKDGKNRYDDLTIARDVTKKLRDAKLTIIDRTEGQESAISEIALSASGVIDINSMKQAGKMAGVDAFFFVYPSVSGFMDKRLSIIVKAVSVETGAVIFVQEYDFEERPIMDLEAQVQTSVYRGYSASMDVYASNPIHGDWAPFHINGDMGNPVLVVKGIFNIPGTLVSLAVGIGAHSATTGDVLSGYPNHYIDDILQTNMTVQGFHQRVIAPMAEIICPVSALFGDRKDSIRFSIGCELLSFVKSSAEGQDGNKLDNTTFPLHLIFSQPADFIVPVVHAGFNFKFLSNIALDITATYMPAWNYSTETIQNVHITYSGTAGIGIMVGLTYKIL